MLVRRCAPILCLTLGALLVGCSGEDANDSDTETEAPATQNGSATEDGVAEPAPALVVLADSQRRLETAGYRVTPFTKKRELTNYVGDPLIKNIPIVASEGFRVKGGGLESYAIAYLYDDPKDAIRLNKTLKGLAHEVHGAASGVLGTRLYFAAEKPPSAAFDRMVEVAERR